MRLALFEHKPFHLHKTHCIKHPCHDGDRDNKTSRKECHNKLPVFIIIIMSAPSAAAPAPSAAAQTFTNNGAFNGNNIVNSGNNIVNNNFTIVDTIVKIPKITNDGKVVLPYQFVPLENEIMHEGKKRADGKISLSSTLHYY